MAWTDPSTSPWLAGHEPTSAELITQVTNNLKAAGDPWTDYTPTWSSAGTAPVLGNGTIVGEYIQVGKWITARVRLTTGSTSTYGTSFYAFSLPAAFPGLVGSWDGAGTCVIRDASGAVTLALPAFLSAATTIAAGDASRLAATYPVTFANGDIINCQVTYQAA